MNTPKAKKENVIAFPKKKYDVREFLREEGINTGYLACLKAMLIANGVFDEVQEYLELCLHEAEHLILWKVLLDEGKKMRYDWKKYEYGCEGADLVLGFLQSIPEF